MPVGPTIRQLLRRQSRGSTDRGFGSLGPALVAWLWLEFQLRKAPKLVTALAQQSGLPGATALMLGTNSLALHLLEGEEQ